MATSEDLHGPRQPSDRQADAVYTTSLDGVVRSWNTTAEDLLGWPAADVVGRPGAALLLPGARDDVAIAMADLLVGATVPPYLAVRRRADDSTVELALSVSLLRDSKGVPHAVAVVAHPRQPLPPPAPVEGYDALTGLPDRARLLQRADAVLARHPEQAALLLVAIDAFKAVNDTLGLATGDEVLRVVARRLVDVAGAGLVGRISGDEFGVLCERLRTPTEAHAMANRIHRVVAERMPAEAGDVIVTASVGIAYGPAPDAATLLGAADAALGSGRLRGPGRNEVFDESLQGPALDRLRLTVDLRGAIDRTELRLHYQPYVDLRTGAAVGVEALLRWQHPVRGLIGPAEFIPLAEETGLIRPIGEWVLRQACRAASSWSRLGPAGAGLQVAVNLSNRQLADVSLVEQVTAAVAAAGLAPGSLVLEVTESAVLADADGAVEALAALRARGTKLAIDDFGAGYSSLAHLKRLPVDEIKIDKSFVEGLGSDLSDSAIVSSVVSLSRAFTAVAVGEGVESDAQAAALRNLGCHIGQGFHWSPARPPEQVPATLTSLAQIPATRRSPRYGVAPEVAARITSMSSQGASLHTIAAALNAEGTRTPKGLRWHAKSVGRVLLQPD